MTAIPQPKLHTPRWVRGRRGTALYVCAAGVAYVLAGILQHGSP